MRNKAMIKKFMNDVSWGNLDYLLIDTPPGTSDEHLAVLAFLLRALSRTCAATRVLIAR